MQQMLAQLGLTQPTGPTHQWSTPTSFHLQLQCPHLQAAFLDCPSLNFPRLKACFWPGPDLCLSTSVLVPYGHGSHGLCSPLPLCPYCLHVILINPASLCFPCPTSVSPPVGVSWGFSGGTSGKEPACQCRRHKRYGSDPWIRKIPWRRIWQPTPIFLPGESHGQRT